MLFHGSSNAKPRRPPDASGHTSQESLPYAPGCDRVVTLGVLL